MLTVCGGEYLYLLRRCSCTSIKLFLISLRQEVVLNSVTCFIYITAIATMTVQEKFSWMSFDLSPQTHKNNVLVALVYVRLINFLKKSIRKLIIEFYFQYGGAVAGLVHGIDGIIAFMYYRECNRWQSIHNSNIYCKFIFVYVLSKKFKEYIFILILKCTLKML